MFLVNEPRSISHGTMRPEDLIPRFISELEDLQNNYIVADGQETEAKERCARTTALLADIEARIEGADYYESEDANFDLENLFDQLQAYAGEGLSFGAHEGDASDYGFWAIDEDEDEDSEPEPTEDDLVTTNERDYYQYGKRVLTIDTDKEDRNAALRAYMDRTQFWPNAFQISDHGNAHLIDLSETE